MAIMSSFMAHVTGTNTSTRLLVNDLGQMPYAAALQLQREIHQSVLQGQAPPTLLLVEHEPVITISQRPGATGHLLADERQLQQMGIKVEATDRGGDITYHGPGQIVAYPIIQLMSLRLSVGRYMRRLEQVAIDTVAAFGVRADRVAGCTGVWVSGEPLRKLCALGIRVRRNVTMHGMALNVDPDMSHYSTIVPCGLTDKGVTSLRQILADICPTLVDVKAELVRQMRRHIETTDRSKFRV